MDFISSDFIDYTDINMTQENKDLLLKDLCMRLPYGVICNLYDVEDANKKFKLEELSNLIISAVNSGCIKPYLRPMSSMTKEEVFEYFSACNKDNKNALITPRYFGLNYLLSHHLDYRGLIPIGLALEAPEEMYK